MCKSPEWNLERLFAIRFHVLCDQQWALKSWGPPSSSTISAQLAGQEGLGVLWEVKGHCYRGKLGFVVCDCAEHRATWPDSPGCGRRSLPSWARGEWALGAPDLGSSSSPSPRL